MKYIRGHNARTPESQARLAALAVRVGHFREGEFERSWPEIAQAMGLSVSTVENIGNRAMRKMRQFVEENRLHFDLPGSRSFDEDFRAPLRAQNVNREIENVL